VVKALQPLRKSSPIVVNLLEFLLKYTAFTLVDDSILIDVKDNVPSGVSPGVSEIFFSTPLVYKHTQLLGGISVTL
jgi:hypothetical protein